MTSYTHTSEDFADLSDSDIDHQITETLSLLRRPVINIFADNATVDYLRDLRNERRRRKALQP